MSHPPPPSRKVMLIATRAERAALLEAALAGHGCELVARLASTDGFADAVGRLAPDVIVIDVAAPDRNTLERLASLHGDNPHPVVMFAEQDDPGAIERALQAGASAYVVGGLDPGRVRSIIDVAMARFREQQALRAELEHTRSQLAARKVIERAKGLLMRHRQLDENAAYRAMRRMAMDRGQPLVDVARNIIAIFDALEPPAGHDRGTR